MSSLGRRDAFHLTRSQQLGLLMLLLAFVGFVLIRVR